MREEKHIQCLPLFHLGSNTTSNQDCAKGFLSLARKWLNFKSRHHSTYLSQAQKIILSRGTDGPDTSLPVKKVTENSAQIDTSLDN